MILIPISYFHLAQGEQYPAILCVKPSACGHHKAAPAGVNMTSPSNMTRAARNMTAGNTTVAHGSSIPTTHPAGGPKL